MSVILLTTDLMLPSQLAGTAAQCGATFATVASLEGLRQAVAAKPPRLVLVDLTLRDLNLVETVSAMRALADPPAVVAYGPHVQEQLLQSARDAGCSEVLARGQLHRDFRTLLQRHLFTEQPGQSGHG